MLGRPIVVCLVVGLVVGCSSGTAGPGASEGDSPPITEAESGRIVGQPVDIASFTVEVTDEGGALLVVTGSVPSSCHEAVFGFEEPNADGLMIGESESWLDPECDGADEPTEFSESMTIEGLPAGDYVARLDREFEASFVIPDRAESTPSTTAAEDTPSLSDLSLVEAFIEFAHQPGAETHARLPLSDPVRLGLGPQIIRTVDRESLRDPEGWVFDVDLFRAYTGPFSPLVQLQALDEYVVEVGEHAHCAGPAQPPPSGLEDLRRISVQPLGESIDSCLDWTTVDFFVSQSGQVEAVTMDLWEP